MGRAYFDVTPELLASVLEMRKSTEIYGAEWSFSTNCVRLYIISNELPELSEGANPPQVRPRIVPAEDGRHNLSWYDALNKHGDTSPA